MPVRDHLLAGEVIVSEHPPFYLTSLRLLHHRQGPEGEQTLALPLERLIGVEEVKTTHHRLMVAGSALFVGGVVLMLTWGLFTAGLAILGGVVALVLGVRGRITGYQILAHNLAPEDAALWQLEHWGAGKFVATLRSRIGGEGGLS
jgi:hypothetical protein